MNPTPSPERPTPQPLTEVAQRASTAVNQATDAAKTCCDTLSARVDGTVERAQECMNRNPMAIVLGAVAIGVAVGLAMVLTRRGPTLRERFVDDPVQTTRDTLYAAHAPVAQRLHEGYDTAGKALHRSSDSWSGQLGRVGNNLKFW